MIKVLLAIVAVVAAFAVGLVGMYFAVPALAPEQYERAQAHLDSLALVDSLSRLYDAEVSEDSLTPQAASLAAAPSSDSLATASPADSLVADTAMTALPAVIEAAGDGAVLQDSLAFLRQRFEVLEREKQGLLEQLETLKAQRERQQERSVTSQELSETLTKLEDKELAGVVEQLDMEVLAMLYEKASARNRTRLLQAMAPPVAASFVRRLVQPAVASGSRAAMPPDTTAAASAVGNEPETMNQ